MYKWFEIGGDLPKYISIVVSAMTRNLCQIPCTHAFVLELCEYNQVPRIVFTLSPVVVLQPHFKFHPMVDSSDECSPEVGNVQLTVSEIATFQTQ